MDNQQERLIWLAGFVDGEGSITLSHQWQAKERLTLRPVVNVTNINVPALQLIEKTLDEAGLAYYIGWMEPGKNGRKHWVWRLNIYGLKRVKRFLEVIMPYLVVKMPQAELLYDWCNYRLGIPRGGNYYEHAERCGYTEYDEQCLLKIRELNQNPQRLYAEHDFKITRDKNGYKKSKDIV